MSFALSRHTSPCNGTGRKDSTQGSQLGAVADLQRECRGLGLIPVGDPALGVSVGCF